MLNLIKWGLISLAVIVLCGTFIAWKKGWLETAQLPPKEQVEEATIYCAQMAGYDDGASDDERLAMAVATLNLAKETGRTTCDIYKNFSALIGPGSTPMFPWFRETPVMYGSTKVSVDRLAAFNQAGLLLVKYLKDPSEAQKKFPWLTCVTRYIRSTWRGITPWPDYSMEKSMKLVWTSPTLHDGRQAEFFCPK